MPDVTSTQSTKTTQQTKNVDKNNDENVEKNNKDQTKGADSRGETANERIDQSNEYTEETLRQVMFDASIAQADKMTVKAMEGAQKTTDAFANL